MITKVARSSELPVTPPGHANRTVRTKYTTVAEILAEYRAMNAAAGVTVCPVCDYLEAHLNDDVIKVEDAIWSHPQWGPDLLAGTIRDTTTVNNSSTHPDGDEIAATVQHDAALALAKHPWGAVRPAIETMLVDPRTRFVDGNAAFVLLSLINANHPNPRRLLQIPAVARKFERFGLDLDRFAAPDFDGKPPQTERPFGH